MGSVAGGTIIGLKAGTGERLWTSTTGADIYDSSFVSAGGSLFVTSVNGVVSSVDPSTGATRWRYRLGPGHALATPAADSQRVYLSSQSGKVTALGL
jgi:outer membrane protein assembly factor BamB